MSNSKLNKTLKNCKNNKNKKCDSISPTLINDYNQFLKNLDFYQQNNDLNNVNQLLNVDSSNPKATIDDIIEKTDINYTVMGHNSVNFNGIRLMDKVSEQMINDDPNKFCKVENPINNRVNSELCCKRYVYNPNSNKSTNLDVYPIRTDQENESGQEKEKEKENENKKELITIECEINSISDILKVIELHPYDNNFRYNINLKALHNIKEPLQNLDAMIGMKDLKMNIVDQILYFIQNLHTLSDKAEGGYSDFLHTVIYGPPGTGKTELARMIGDIFSKLGILKKGTFKKATRSDLIAGFLGQTAMKTKETIDSCLGGVLFIDEAYSLGNTEKRDSFAKECIDTLCEGLSAHKHNLMVIIAGYETELKECFFSYNQGLDSRFTWRFKTDNYDSDELRQIFIKKIGDIGWTIDEDSQTKINKEWFEKNKGYFKFFGRDMETLLSKVKIVHSRRVFCKIEDDKRKITLHDLNKGLELFLKNEEVKTRKEREDIQKMVSSMYM